MNPRHCARCFKRCKELYAWPHGNYGPVIKASKINVCHACFMTHYWNTCPGLIVKL